MERVHSELIRRLSGSFDFVVLSHTLQPDLSKLVTWRRVRTPRRPAAIALPLFFGVGSLYAARLDVDILHTCGAIVGNRAQLSTVHFCHAGFRIANEGLAPKGASIGRQLNTAFMRSFAIRAEQWCYRSERTEVLGAVSRRVEDELSEHYPFARVVSTPNGVDTERFHPDISSRLETRRSRRVRPDEIVALFVGGDWDRKGLALAIEGVAEARRLGAPLRLWVLGSGPRDRFHRYAIDRGVVGEVDFLGQDDEPARWYQGADIYLCCSKYEAFSLAMIEAASSQLPVVTTAVGGAAEIVYGEGEAHRPGGVIVERDATELARVLASLAIDHDRRRQLGATARIRADSFGWDRLAETTAMLYSEILKDSGRRPEPNGFKSAGSGQA